MFIPIIIPIIVGGGCSIAANLATLPVAAAALALTDGLIREGYVDSMSNTVGSLAHKARSQKQKNVDFWIPEGDERK